MTRRAFTLVETLLALSIAAALLAATVAVLFGALRMRRAAAELEDEKSGTYRLASVLHADLSGAVVPAGLMAGAMILESTGSGDTASDTIEFCTASGALDDDAPWGDIRKVEYLLDTENENTDDDSYPLVRRETVNLLASTEDDADLRDTVLVARVRALSIECYADSAWTESWDSTTMENANPTLVRVTVTPVEGEPMVFVEQVMTQPRPTPVAATAGGGGATP